MIQIGIQIKIKFHIKMYSGPKITGSLDCFFYKISNMSMSSLMHLKDLTKRVEDIERQ